MRVYTIQYALVSHRDEMSEQVEHCEECAQAGLAVLARLLLLGRARASKHPDWVPRARLARSS